MTYDIEFVAQAERYLRRLDRVTQARIAERIDQIAADPFGARTKLLKVRPGQRATRVGDWRILFVVDVERRLITVTELGPRGQVYRPR